MTQEETTMLLMQLILDRLLMHLILIGGLLIALIQQPPMQITVGFVVFCLVVMLVIELFWILFIHKFSRKEQVEKLARDLWHPSRWRQRGAVNGLTLMVGTRFGRREPLFGRRRYYERATLCWRNWWEQNAQKLVWDPILQCYVEREENAVTPPSPA